MNNYPILVRPMDEDEGAGFVVEVPDLPGCLADGSTPEEAIKNVAMAIEEWIETARALGREIPKPNDAGKFSGKWVQRVPRSLHQKLVHEAKREGVSLNAFATSILAEGVGKRHVPA